MRRQPQTPRYRGRIEDQVGPMAFLLACPNCGERNVGEFRFGGELMARPAPDATHEEWAENHRNANARKR